jgi:DEAD/DEAH box helicase domain-containing protein
MGSLHAVEHASIALLPLFALCDRNDLGGISFTRHAETGGPTIFIYDGHPGGVGLAPRSYEVIDDLFERAGALVADCPCEEGCPSCIHSPKCGHGNQPLDKAGALRVFQHLTGGPELRGDPALAHSRYGTRGSAQTEPIEPRPSPPTEAELAVKAVEGGEAPGEAWADRRPLLEGRDVVVFDLETQLSAKEVGGWHNAHLMRIALGVTWERREERFRTWMEEDAPDLAARLARADLVVGFNQKGFDYAVLSIYTGLDLRGLPSLDLLEEIRLQHSIRLPLAALAAGTLGAGKTADGLQSLQWWKEGRVEEIERYCRMDVELTARLLEYALEHGHLLFTRDGAEEPIRLPLALDVERLLKPRD